MCESRLSASLGLAFAAQERGSSWRIPISQGEGGATDPWGDPGGLH